MPWKQYRCNRRCDTCPLYGVTDVTSDTGAVHLPALTGEQKKLIEKFRNDLSSEQMEELKLRM
jgi:hypothetical protein